MTDLHSLSSLRGSLITLKRRCGKPNCHCAKGRPHLSPALSFKFKGKSRILTLHQADLPAVRRALSRYRLASAQLAKEADRGLLLLEKYLRQLRET